MSLLMKALEKAAKDRGDTQQKQPDAAASAAASTHAPAAPAVAAPAAPKPLPAAELTLEPLASDKPSPANPKHAPQSAGRPAKNNIDRDDDQALAATVMQATAAATSAARPRIRPVLAIGAIAGVIALALAIYVYLQITNPALFIRQQPAPVAPPAPFVQAPAPAQPPIATNTIVAPAEPESKPVVREARDIDPPRAARRAPPVPATAEAPRDSIRISAGTATPQLDPRLPQAYAALQAGNLGVARQLYADAARSEPKSVNALLGLAAIAMQDGKTDEASRLYFNVLDLEPRNAYAQTGLIAMMGRADPLAAESRLKHLIAREPIASLHFTLGNLYADQSRWAEAQLAYFQAHQLEPANPDYAYNLAVGLEHVGQPKLAAGFYQRAVSQAQANRRAGFNLKQAQDRIRQLASRPE